MQAGRFGMQRLRERARFTQRLRQAIGAPGERACYAGRNDDAGHGNENGGHALRPQRSGFDRESARHARHPFEKFTEIHGHL